MLPCVLAEHLHRPTMNAEVKARRNPKVPMFARNPKMRLKVPRIALSEPVDLWTIDLTGQISTQSCA